MVAEDILLKLAAEYVDEAVLKQAAENARLFQIANSQANVLAVLLTDGLLDEATAQKIMKKAKLVSSERTSVMQAAKGLEEAIRNAKREAEETMALAETAGTSFEKEQDFGMAEKTGTSFERTEGEQKPARYKVIEKLGEGGMGAVYLFQDRLMKRPVALKKVKSDLPKATRDFCIAKFGKEVAATSLFYECDYLVKAYNVQKDEHGDPFLTLEYVRGETLA
ncbi:hypothetical protein KY310_02335, partial [Candidatus Woesearchaeota archaeon]|nr:hypothetical protein [Candidatus Woesearchaeota archaeon]